MSEQQVSFYIKTNRAFSTVRQYAWLITLLIAIGGLFIPYLGLLVPFIMAALILMSLFKGRYWCGNVCPHGSLFDQVLQPLSRQVKIPAVLRSRTVIILVLLFFMFNLGRNFYGALTRVELGSVQLYEQLGVIFSNTYLVVLLAGGLLAIAVNTRTWCQFCPMGTFQLIFYRLGKVLGINHHTDEKVSVEHPELCHSCGKCARVCPMQLTPYLHFSENNQLEDEKCIRCFTCVNNCPAGILHMANRSRAEELNQNVNLDGFNEARFYKAQIKTIRELKEDIKEYTFKLEEPPAMSFAPGQFVLVEIDESIKMFRAYTISSSSPDSSEISITVKKLEDGYGTNILFHRFQEGDNLTVKGPMGRELRVDTSAPELLFIANGIGITPFVSSAQALFERGDTRFEGRATLLYGARHEEDLVYEGYFSDVSEKHHRFNYYRVLSRPRTDHYKKGYVTDLLNEIDIPPETLVYICGTPVMASDAKKLLKGKGVPEKNIFYENFGV